MPSGERIWSGAGPGQVAADLQPLLDWEDEGLALDSLKRMLDERLAPHLMRYELPAFQAAFNASPEEGAALGAALALAYNQGVTNWQVSPGGAVLEEMCCQALCRLFGLAPGADATFMLAGTYANQQALYMALHRHAERRGFDLAQEGLSGFEQPGRLAVLVSQDAHLSLRHAVRTLGLGERCLVNVALDENRRLDPGRLAETVEALAGRDVFCIVATAGTTPTGAVDPLPPLAALCARLGAWFHVDGAYGLAYRLVPEWQPLFAGLELADSAAWDPHKQLRVPIPSSILFARQRQDFARLALHADYFNRQGDAEPNPGLKSMPSTRPLAALPLVASLRHLGLARLRENLRAPLVAIRDLAGFIRSQEDLELCHWPDTGILCFRVVPPGLDGAALDRLQQRIHDGLRAEGRRAIALTRLDGRAVLRLVAISPAVTAEALLDTVAALRALAAQAIP